MINKQTTQMSFGHVWCVVWQLGICIVIARGCRIVQLNVRACVCVCVCVCVRACVRGRGGGWVGGWGWVAGDGWVGMGVAVRVRVRVRVWVWVWVCARAPRVRARVCVARRVVQDLPLREVLHGAMGATHGRL